MKKVKSVLLQPVYQADKENSAPEALLVSGQSPNETADGTPSISEQRCSSIWSRRENPPVFRYKLVEIEQ